MMVASTVVWLLLDKMLSSMHLKNYLYDLHVYIVFSQLVMHSLYTHTPGGASWLHCRALSVS